MIQNLLYNSIKNVFSGDSTIKTVLPYNNQYLNQNINKVVKYPAIYIELGTILFDKNNSCIDSDTIQPQTGNVDLNIYVVYHTLKDHNNDNEVIFNNLIDYVYWKLTRLGGSSNADEGNFTSLQRIREERFSPSDMLRVAKITFHTKITDCTNIDKVQKTLSAVNFTITYEDEDEE